MGGKTCFWMIAAGIALIAVGTLYGSGAPAAGPAPAHQTLPVSLPLARDFSNPAPAHRPSVIATVFECRRHGRLVFSDQRCGSDAQLRRIEEPSRMDAPDIRVLTPRTPSALH